MISLQDEIAACRAMAKHHREFVRAALAAGRGEA